MVARRAPVEERRVRVAPTTKARHRTGMENMANINPIIPVAIDLSIIREVANDARSIRATVPQRSS